MSFCLTEMFLWSLKTNLRIRGELLPVTKTKHQSLLMDIKLIRNSEYPNEVVFILRRKKVSSNTVFEFGQLLCFSCHRTGASFQVKDVKIIFDWVHFPSQEVVAYLAVSFSLMTSLGE